MERESMENQQNKLGIFTTSSAAVEEAGGHRPDTRPRGKQILGAGMPHSTLPDRGDSYAESSRARANVVQGRLPKLHFLMFSGDDPQLWRSRCEIYFDMYDVESSLWIKVATMHFEGAAARWLQSVERG
jgi:hypothetical protein